MQDKINKAIPIEVLIEECLNRTRYFTPSIEDIRVGYEFEYCPDIHLTYFGGEKNNERVYKTLIHKDGAIYTSGNKDRGPFSIEEAIKDGVVRVPYLTKEQIEAEGWKESEISKGIMTMDNKPVYTFRRGDIVVCYFTTDNTLKVHVNVKDDTDYYNLYKGKCKDINTFRYICKLLGI